MIYKHSFAPKILLIMACSALPAAADTNCSSIAGIHSGTFTAKTGRVNSTYPKTLSGTWTITINSKTIKTMDLATGKYNQSCSVVGSVSSDLFGTVKVTGEYGVYFPLTASFEARNLFMQDGSLTKFNKFTFVGNDNRHVHISNNDYAYIGEFSADK